MTEPRAQPLVTPGIPRPRAPGDHPMRPDLPTQREATSPLSGAARHAAAPGTGTPGTGTRPAYGAWRYRAAALLVDSLVQVPFVIAVVVGLVVAFDGGGLTRVQRPGSGVWNDGLAAHVRRMTTHTWVGLAIAGVAGVGLVVFALWNNIVRQGRQGASLGKQSMNLVVVRESSGRPIGPLMTCVRAWVHVIDLVLGGFGFLWPLWDHKRQTFADMILGTAVLHFPQRPAQSESPLVGHITPRYHW